ncbi:hypothetical protein LMG8323_04138 [Ralstonia mannitolilytica]|nr:hypothetical protein LMG8323_04138 [Ralstonia mannitolilytica]
MVHPGFVLGDIIELVADVDIPIAKHTFPRDKHVIKECDRIHFFIPRAKRMIPRVHCLTKGQAGSSEGAAESPRPFSHHGVFHQMPASQTQIRYRLGLYSSSLCLLGAIGVFDAKRCDLPSTFDNEPELEKLALADNLAFPLEPGRARNCGPVLVLLHRCDGFLELHIARSPVREFGTASFDVRNLIGFGYPLGIGSMSFRVESNTVTGASPARTGWPAGA